MLLVHESSSRSFHSSLVYYMASHEKEGTLPYLVHKSAMGPLGGHPISLGLSKR